MQLFETIAHLFHPRRSNNHRPRLLHPEVLITLIFIGLGFFFALKPAGFLIQKSGYVLGYASNITASDVISKTNIERNKLGLPELISNSKLNEAALAKAQHMFENQYWAHIAPDGTDPWFFFKKANYKYKIAGENLARDFSHTDEMMQAWMASPTHKANILNSKYTEIGIAVVDGKLLGAETTLVVQLFGAPQVAVAQLPDTAVTQTPKGAAADVPAEESHLTFAERIPAQLPKSVGPAVLGSGMLPFSLIESSPLLSPLQLTKAFFLAVIILIIMTLMYDAIIMSNRNTVRLVGKNFAHIMLLAVVAFLLIFFKGGVIG